MDCLKKVGAGVPLQNMSSSTNIANDMTHVSDNEQSLVLEGNRQYKPKSCLFRLMKLKLKRKYFNTSTKSIC